MTPVEKVCFKQVYDLVFRARNARLKTVAYVLDFYEWMKAGIAFNTRGFELSTRKISYFASLYSMIERAKTEGVEILEQNRSMLETALQYYYADIFEVYQDHIKAKHSEASFKNQKARNRSGVVQPEFGNLLILPAFDRVPELREVFITREVGWNNYQCVDRDRFSYAVASAYVKEDSPLYHCMSLMYDYGHGLVDAGELLEVTLWDKA